MAIANLSSSLHETINGNVVHIDLAKGSSVEFSNELGSLTSSSQWIFHYVKKRYPNQLIHLLRFRLQGKCVAVCKVMELS